jgi:hypothetical protein
VRNLGVDVRRFRPTDAGRRMVRRPDFDQPVAAEQAAAVE